MRKWIDQCVEGHEKCSLPDTTPLPTRILDVGLGDETADPVLLVSQGKRARYACLSYCWGQERQPVVLANNTLSSLCQGIPLGTLLQTIQDAITTTRRLGLRYLWVDSLCIIQDSAEDKAVEISRMDEIYRQGFVTISAASGGDYKSGFLQKRARWWDHCRREPAGGISATDHPFLFRFDARTERWEKSSSSGPERHLCKTLSTTGPGLSKSMCYPVGCSCLGQNSCSGCVVRARC